MKKLDRSLLMKLYSTELKTPAEIGILLGCNHKTVRKYLRLYKIPLRSSSQYNYLARKTHKSPEDNQLYSPISLMGHIAYLCEGWHTEKTNMLYFVNTDPQLIDLFLSCVRDIYSVEEKSIHITVFGKTAEELEPLIEYYPNAKPCLENTRITPIVRVRVGGKVLAEEFINNAYKILSKG